jgi:hypothetical protein
LSLIKDRSAQTELCIAQIAILFEEVLAGRAAVEHIKNYRAVALLCRQRAALCPQASWHWLAEAERYEDLAEAEVEAHFKECNGGVEFDANLAAA